MAKSVFKYKIEPQYVDFTDRVSVSSICDLVLHAAGADAHRRGFGIDALADNNYGWVLSRMAIEMDYMPAEYSEFTLHTWISDYNRLSSTRNFTLTDSEGREFGRAVSQWCNPYSGNGCGECHRCVEACPNGAIRDHHIDTRLCISRATVERQSDRHTPLHGWIFGCDQCQSCCPYNTKAQRVTNPLFMPTIEPETIDWHSMSQADFSLRFAASPIIRTTLARIRENVEE